MMFVDEVMEVFMFLINRMMTVTNQLFKSEFYYVNGNILISILLGIDFNHQREVRTEKV